MLKNGVVSSLNGKLPKNSENQKKNTTFVPVNRIPIYI
jgi:hypothetical protein